jgi:predicted molibdopterin-dependent oxidoreductase YjgC
MDVLVLLGADPLADYPDRYLAEAGLTGARTVIALDQFLTESVKQADVVLPVAGFAEVDGTTTNLEGRVSALARKVTAPRTAQSDWMVAAELAYRLGHDLGLESPGQITAEIAATAPAFAGLSLDVLTAPGGSDGVVVMLPTRRNGDAEADEAGDAAPSAAATAAAGDGPTDAGGAETAVGAVGTAGDATTGDATTGTPPEVQATHLLPPATGVPLPVWTIIDPPSVDAYSLRLVVTRKLYDRGTLVANSPWLSELAEPATLRLSPHDFDRLGVAVGDDVRVTSNRGNVSVPTVPDPGVPRGIAHLHANKAGGRANVLIDGNAPITDVRVERP